MKKRKYGVFPIIGIISGVAAIIIGISMIGTGDYAVYTSFGGDFYTYSYKATRYAANNLCTIIDILAYFAIVWGVYDISYFGCKLMENSKIPDVSQNEVDPASVETPTVS